MNVGDLVKVIGISSKGKNRVREHGAIWKIRRTWNSKFLLESTDGKDNWRWVDVSQDKDFEIVEVERV